MKRLLPLLLLLGACATPGEGQLLRPSFRARRVVLGAVRGARGKGVEISRALVARLGAEGLEAVSLEESDSVLAGSEVSLDAAMNPRLLAEIRRATDADALIFLSLDPAWRSLEISALDAGTGDAVLRAAAHPRGDAFADADEIAVAASHPLSALSSARRAPRASAADDPLDEIPLP